MKFLQNIAFKRYKRRSIQLVSGDIQVLTKFDKNRSYSFSGKIRAKIGQNR